MVTRVESSIPAAPPVKIDSMSAAAVSVPWR